MGSIPKSEKHNRMCPVCIGRASAPGYMDVKMLVIQVPGGGTKIIYAVTCDACDGKGTLPPSE